jgi:hypothetical protein
VQPPLARPALFRGAVLACLVLAALLRPIPSQFKFRDGGDCVRYLTWSRVVQQKGLRAFPLLVDEYRTKWVGFPPPTRFTYLLANAAVMALWKAPADEYHPLVLISWLCSVLALLPLAWWLRRLGLPPEVVLLALLLEATSPVPRAMAHFPVPDAPQLLVGLTLYALVAEWQANPRRWALWALAAAAFLTVTVREIGLFMVFAAASLVVLDRVRGGAWRLAPLWALAGGCAAALVCTVLLAGGPTPFLLMVKDYVRGNLNTGNSALVGGPYYRYLVDFAIVTPVLTVTALVGLGALWRDRDVGKLAATVALTSVVYLAWICGLTKAIRYAMPVDAALRGVVAAVLVHLFRRRTALAMAGAAALALALFGHDLVLYHQLWGNDEIYDPLTFNMARQLGMIP